MVLVINNNGKVSDMPNIAKVLKLLRMANGFTTTELAKKIGISQAHLSAIERGKRNVTEDLLKRYSKTLKVSLSTLRYFCDTSSKGKLKTQEILLLILSQICKTKKLECSIKLKEDDVDENMQ